MKKILALILALTLCLGLFAGCKGDDTPETSEQTVDLSGTYKITMWVSEIDGVVDLTKQQIAKFNQTNEYGITIEAEIEGVTEADAGSKVVADVASAPDIFCFAQDQLARLVQASALAAPGQGAVAAIKANNDGGSVNAATVAGTVYAYPMTSDNGYYMYYDTSIISEEDAESLESLIAACEKSGKKFRFALENAWYTASFFFATECSSVWYMDQNGEYINVEDNYNSDAGLISMKGMQKLAQSSCYDSNADIFTDAGVVITGIWNANAAADHFGDNLGATDLPSFTVDGKSYHLGSYSGNKLMGVKPNSDAKTAAVLSLLAQYLTSEECQIQRFESFQWGPSNKNAQATEAVQANISLAALAKQSEYAYPEANIHGSWWDLAKLLGAEAKAATSEDDLKDALVEYETAVKAVLTMSDEQKAAWSLIGGIGGTSWDTDFTMTKIDDTTWESDAIELHAGEQFKIRQGAAWDVQVGAGGVMKTPEVEPDNITVEADGTYKIQLIWDGTSTTATVNFIPAE